MRELPNVAEQAAEICLAAVTYVTGSALGFGDFVTPLATLVAIASGPVLRSRANCAVRAQEATLAALRGVPEYRHADFDRVVTLLQDSRSVATLDPAALDRASRAGPTGFRDALVSELMRSIPFEADDHLPRRVVVAAFEASVDCLARDEEMRFAIDRALLLAGARDHGLTLSLLKEIKEDTEAILAGQASTDAKVNELLRLVQQRPGLSDERVREIARRYVEGSPDDLEAALRGIEAALQRAEQERARHRSDSGEPVDEAIARVERLNEEGRLAEGANAIDEALRTRREREQTRREEEKAATQRLLDAGISQAVQIRSVPDATRYVLELIEQDEVDPSARFARLRDELRDWYERGHDKGLSFDLEVAIALGRTLVSRAQERMDKVRSIVALANSVKALGQKQTGSQMLEEAVRLNEEALQLLGDGFSPEAQALVLNNLGNAYVALGQRTSNSIEYRCAIDAFKKAISFVQVPEREFMPWATFHVNLGNANRALATRSASSDHIQDAMTAYNKAYEKWSIAHRWTSENLAATTFAIGSLWGDAAKSEQGTYSLLRGIEFLQESLAALGPLTPPIPHGKILAQFAELCLLAFEKSQEHVYLDRADKLLTYARQFFESVKSQFDLNITADLRSRIDVARARSNHRV